MQEREKERKPFFEANTFFLRRKILKWNQSKKSATEEEEGRSGKKVTHDWRKVQDPTCLKLNPKTAAEKKMRKGEPKKKSIGGHPVTGPDLTNTRGRAGRQNDGQRLQQIV